MKPASFLLLLAACGGDPGARERPRGASSPADDTAGPAPQVVAWHDQDGDGFGDGASGSYDASPGTVRNSADCDDRTIAIRPGAVEICNGTDDDCDGDVDEDALDPIPFWPDADHDGYGAQAPATLSCSRPTWSFAAQPGDCDDADATEHPGAVERCNGRDDDCDGAVDHADPGGVLDAAWYADRDGDGFGDGAAASGCSPGPGWTETSGDCDDADAAVSPGAPEVCADGRDTDCDGESACSFSDADVLVHLGRAGPIAGAFGLGDLDGDGWAEIAVTARATHGPRVFLLEAPLYGTVDASEAGLSFRGSTDAEALTAAGPAGDLDGDGIGEVWAAGRWSTARGRFEPVARVMDVSSGAPVLVARLAGAGETGLGAGDLDGDGAHELVFTGTIDGIQEPDSSRTLVFEAPLAADLAPEDARAALMSADPSTRLHGGDLDGDGDPDFAVGLDGVGIVYIARERVSGTLDLRDLTDRVTGGRGAWVRAAAGPDPVDLDGDGQADLILSDGQDLLLMAGPFVGARTADEAWARITGRAELGSVACPDVDGDGAPELTLAVREEVGDLDAQAFHVVAVPSGGVLVLSQPALRGPAGSWAMPVPSAGDLDGDAQDDLVLTTGWDEPFPDAGGLFVLSGAGLSKQ